MPNASRHTERMSAFLVNLHSLQVGMFLKKSGIMRYCIVNNVQTLFQKLEKFFRISLQEISP